MIEAPTAPPAADLTRWARVPSALTDLPNWVLWKMEPREPGKPPTKIPYAVAGYRAKSSDPGTWATYHAVLDAYAADPGRWSGIAFMLAEPVVGIDFDNALDAAGELLPWAREWIDPAATYGEVSPSRTGVKFFGLGKLPGEGKGINLKGFGPAGAGGIEIYGHARPFTVTGQRFAGSPLAVRDFGPVARGIYAGLRMVRAQRKAASTPPPPTPRREGPAGDRLKRCLAYCDKLPPSISGNGGHAAFFTAMCEGVRFDLSGSEMMALAEWWNDAKSDEKWSPREIEHKIKQAEREAGPDRGKRLAEDRPLTPRTNGNGRAHAAPSLSGTMIDHHADQPPPAAGEYVLVPGPHSTDMGEEIERGAGEFVDDVVTKFPAGTLYDRGGIPGQIGGEPGGRSFGPLTPDGARVAADRAMKFGRWRSGGGDNPPTLGYVPCSRDHAGLIIAGAAGHPRVPKLVSITPYPVYRPGFRLSEPGFCDGLYYDEPPELRGLVPVTDAKAIRKTFADLLIDFPLTADADRQNYIGLLLSAMLRPAIDGNVPGYLIHASLERTGKTKLAEMLGMIVTGRRTPAMQIAETNEEMDKRILSALLRGDTLLHLDNLKEWIDLPCLASLLTATIYQGRLLGSSKLLDIPNNLVIVATGNNVRATGEMVKRMVPVRLQPRTDAPELRTDFVHPDLWAFVRQQRRHVLECLLGMVELWKRAGSPRGTKPMGGFDEWAATVGGIMAVAGFDQWMGNAAEWRADADTGRSDVRALVDEWAKEHGSAPLKVAEILAIAERLELFPEILGGREGKALQTSFGMRVLSRNVDTPVGEWVIHKNSLSRPAIYSLKPLKQGGDQ